MALLGLIHRSVLGRGPGYFAEFFRPDVTARSEASSRDVHRLQLVEYSEAHWTDFMYPNSRPADYIGHSMLGLVSIYNRLPAYTVEGSSSVSSFQAALQAVLRTKANADEAGWATTFSPRRRR